MKAPIARHLDRLWQIHAPLTLFALLFAAATVLFATLMMGPIGLLLYFAVRNLRTNIFSN